MHVQVSGSEFQMAAADIQCVVAPLQECLALGTAPTQSTLQEAPLTCTPLASPPTSLPAGQPPHGPKSENVRLAEKAPFSSYCEDTDRRAFSLQGGAAASADRHADRSPLDDGLQLSTGKSTSPTPGNSGVFDSGSSILFCHIVCSAIFSGLMITFW